MAFEGLSSRSYPAALSKLTSRGKLTEQAVKEGMRDVRMALLEADVNYLVVKDFCQNRSPSAAVGAAGAGQPYPGPAGHQDRQRGNDRPDGRRATPG